MTSRYQSTQAMPTKTLRNAPAVAFQGGRREAVGQWRARNSQQSQTHPQSVPAAVGHGTSAQALQRWQMAPVCSALGNKTRWNALQKGCQAEPRALSYRQKQPHRLEEWHLCKDRSPWHPSSGWWRSRILITKWCFWFSAAKTWTCRCDLFFTPHPANPCFAEPMKRLGVPGPGSGASKPTERTGAQERQKCTSDFPWTQESQPKIISMYTEQIYTNPAKFTPGDLGYGYVYCFHLFPGAEVDDLPWCHLCLLTAILRTYIPLSILPSLMFPLNQSPQQHSFGMTNIFTGLSDCSNLTFPFLVQPAYHKFT